MKNKKHTIALETEAAVRLHRFLSIISDNAYPVSDGQWQINIGKNRIELWWDEIAAIRSVTDVIRQKFNKEGTHIVFNIKKKGVTVLCRLFDELENAIRSLIGLLYAFYIGDKEFLLSQSDYDSLLKCHQQFREALPKKENKDDNV